MELRELFDRFKKSPLISDVHYIEQDKHGFSRIIKFSIRGQYYCVTWFKNVSTLWNQDLKIRFNSFEITTNWPSHRSNYDLILKQYGEPVAIIKLDDGDE